jgi:hypothetical protein
MNNPDKSFRLDAQNQSFQVQGFKWIDGFLLSIAFCMVFLLGLVFGWFPANFLPEKVNLVCSGFFLGCCFCLAVYRWLSKSRSSPTILATPGSPIQNSSATANLKTGGSATDLSSEVQRLAQDPKQLIAAIKLYRREHPSAGLAEARERIEQFRLQGR